MTPDAPLTCILLGAGGHARVLLEILLGLQGCRISGMLDANPKLWNQRIQDIPALGGDDLLGSLAIRGVTHFVVAVGSTARTTSRQRLFQKASQCGLIPLDVIHPTAVISPSAKTGPGFQCLASATLNAGARLQQNVLINTGAIVEHDCLIADHVHIASRAVLCGQVAVGPGSHIGAGAVVRQCIRIGEGCVVGAGAVVVHDVPDATTVVGVPARPLKGTEGAPPLAHI